VPLIYAQLLQSAYKWLPKVEQRGAMVMVEDKANPCSYIWVESRDLGSDMADHPQLWDAW
jgi:hypothetical protein